MRPLLALMAVAFLVSGCTDDAEKHKKDLGTAVADVAADTKTLGDVQSSVNEVIRDMSDCDRVKAALPEARRKMDAATDALRTTAGRATLDAYRAQVKAASNNCP
jgi:hypothetical protein